FLIERALNPFLAEIAAERYRETETITRHVEISLNEMIHRQSLRHAEVAEAYEKAPEVPLNAANLTQSEDRLHALHGRLDRRRGAPSATSGTSAEPGCCRTRNALHRPSPRWCRTKRSSGSPSSSSPRCWNGRAGRSRAWRRRTGAST